MEKVELKKGIYWVGAIDWNIRDFHGYSTPYGTTYNAYLILDEKNILVDTVKAPFYLEMLGRISEIIDPSRIDVVVRTTWRWTTPVRSFKLSNELEVLP